MGYCNVKEVTMEEAFNALEAGGKAWSLHGDWTWGEPNLDFTDSATSLWVFGNGAGLTYTAAHYPQLGVRPLSQITAPVRFYVRKPDSDFVIVPKEKAMELAQAGKCVRASFFSADPGDDERARSRGLFDVRCVGGVVQYRWSEWPDTEAWNPAPPLAFQTFYAEKADLPEEVPAPGQPVADDRTLTRAEALRYLLESPGNLVISAGDSVFSIDHQTGHLMYHGAYGFEPGDAYGFEPGDAEVDEEGVWANAYAPFRPYTPPAPPPPAPEPTIAISAYDLMSFLASLYFLRDNKEAWDLAYDLRHKFSPGMKPLCDKDGTTFTLTLDEAEKMSRLARHAPAGLILAAADRLRASITAAGR